METLSDSHLLWMALVRGLLVFGVVLLIGELGFFRFIFEPVLDTMPPEASASLRRMGERFVRRVVIGAVLFLFLVNAVALVHEGMMMSGKGVFQVFSLLPVVLTRTHWGGVWIARTLLLTILIGLAPRRCTSTLVLILSVGVAVTVSLISHAVDAGDLSLPVLADAVHLIFVSLWIGGLVPLRFLTRKICIGLDLPRQRNLLLDILNRYSRMAVTAVVLIIITGVYGAWLHVPSLADLTQKAYGEILLAKVAFAVGTMSLGGVSRFIIIPCLKHARSTERVIWSFWGVVLVECVAALLTLSLAALLTQAPPIRH
ncbi:MAG TPA: CopD family protein [Nitrospiria bacterium]|nr:CopD family protein [Nitrospiria bacterium]